MAFTDRLANRGSISTGFDIENSCRFDNWYNYTQANTGPDDTGDDYLYRDNMLNDISTYDSDNGQKWVLSFWIKRGGRWVGNPYQNKGSYGHTSDAVRNRQAIWGSSNSARYSWFGFDSMTDNEDALIFDMKIGGVGHEFITNAQYRDHAAWYHIFVKMDTTQSTSTDRFQLWVNGVRVTSWDAYATITQNAENAHPWADGTRHYFGRHYQTSSGFPFHGYLAEAHYSHNQTTVEAQFVAVDTTPYVATTFGEFNDDGIWVPIEPDIGYGHQAYHLDFQDASDLGKDVSGMSNDFDSFSMSAVNQCTDTPTNNWCTMQPMQNASGGTQPRTLMGGLRVTEGGSSHQSSHATMGVTTGKWYYEHYMEDDYNTPQNHGAGWIGTKQDMTGNGSGWTRLSTYTWYGMNVGFVVNGWADSGTGAADNNNSGTGDNFSGSNAAEDDVMGTAVDLDAGKMWFHIRGVWHTPDSNIGVPASGTYPGFTNIATVLDGTQHLVPAQNMYTSGPPIRLLNFGNPPTTVFTAIGTHADDNGYGSFSYAPPTGFLALCSKNIGESGLSNIVDDPSEHFQTTLWTGTGSSQSITNLGNSDLQPDLVWFKKRSASGDHRIIDSSRGVTKYIAANSDAAEGTYAGYITSFNSDGFSIAAGDGSSNTNAEAYVAWNWKMNGGTTTTNTEGNVNVTLQANVTAGQSIGLYEGTNTASRTFGHGLGAKPHFVVFKCRDSGNLGGAVWHHRISPGNGLYLHSNTAKYSIGGTAYGTFTNSLIELNAWGPVNGSVESFMFLAFTSIEGYSKFDIFEGNDPSNYETDDNGTFVYTGFKPAFVMYKPIDVAASWVMFDNKRNKGGAAAAAEGSTGNENQNTMWERLFVDTDAIQSSATENFMDFLSNGFQIKISDATLCDSWNEDGNLYVYAAFAEQPFISSKGVPCTAR